MTLDNLKSIRDVYFSEAIRPDGKKSTRAEYIKLSLDGGIDLVTSKDLVIFDDSSEIAHAICINEDMRSQAMFPVKIISSQYDMIQQVEGIMSQKNFEEFLNDGFLNGIISNEKKEAMIKWTRAIRNQAQQPLEAEPYFNTNPTIIPKPNSIIKRDDTSSGNVALETVSNSEDFLACLNKLTESNAHVVIDIIANINMGTEPFEINSNCDVTINLNGNTITSSAATLFKITEGKLTVKDGSINTSGESFRLDATEGTNPELILGEDVEVISENDCCIFLKGPVKVTSAATLTSNGSYCPIQGNGNIESAGSEINIIGGTITSDDVGIYHPQDGILNLTNCNIVGKTAIYAKAGVINIHSGTYTGTADATAYTFNNNGCNATGDAIVADFCGYPGGIPTINISGGSFYSNNNNAIEAYDKDGNINPEDAKSHINITGGVFSTTPNADYIEDGYSIEDSDGMSTVVKSA